MRVPGTRANTFAQMTIMRSCFFSPLRYLPGAALCQGAIFTEDGWHPFAEIFSFSLVTNEKLMTYAGLHSFPRPCSPLLVPRHGHRV